MREDKRDKIYSPEYVVLHRCQEDSGCCINKANSFICLPVEEKIEEIKMQFAVTPLLTQNKTVFEDIILKNHTKCACEKIQNL